MLTKLWLCVSSPVPEQRLESHGLALTFAGIRVEPNDPKTSLLTVEEVFNTFHSMHDHVPLSVTGDALLDMDTSAPAGTTAHQMYKKAQRLHKKGLAFKAGPARDAFLANTKWAWPGNDNVILNTRHHTTAHTQGHTGTPH
jgi:hypothetical protein